MKNQEIKFKNNNSKYSILIGKNVITALPKRIKILCPKTKKIAVIIDKNVPRKFKNILKNILKNFKIIFFSYQASEKKKTFNDVNKFLTKLLSNNFNRSDLIIGVGGGITGDLSGFVASIFKRGINFINIPTTLLAQVDSAIGGKTGVNTSHGKNLVGSFYQPKLVLSDTNFLNSLSKKEIVCGYAEILKHAIIKDPNFFSWLERNTEKILLKKPGELTYAIKKSCLIKLHFVNKDVNERGIRMALNFGHTFAHAIEVKNNYSKKISHGEAVLGGIILESKMSVLKKICNIKILNRIESVYKKNNLTYTYKKFLNANRIKSLIPFLKNDKKNNDEKINFILLKDLGKTTKPNNFKFSIKNLNNLSKFIARF